MRKEFMPLNLQFFAEDVSQDNDTEEMKQQEDNNSSDNNSSKKEKTFTQEQVSAMMSKEKHEGKMAMLKSLGYTSEKEAKEAAKLLKTLLDSQKPDDEKLKEENQKALQEKEDAEARALSAENKLTCFQNGVNKDSIDDVLAIAVLKVSDSKSLEKVLQEMKKEKRYSVFFEQDGNGTGSEPGHNGSSAKSGDLGKRLGELNKVANEGKKSSFFSD